MTRITPTTKAIVGYWRFAQDDQYHLQITEDGQNYHGDSLESAAAYQIHKFFHQSP